MAYINSTRTVVNNVGTDIALAGAENLFTVSGSLGGTKSLTLSDGFINNGAPEANLIVPLLFPNGHNDLGPSLYLEITVAGVTNPIPVVSNQNGTLLPIPHHEMIEGGSTVYKVVDPNTILNMYYTADYDGSQNPAFVVVGNPLVLSSSTYSIYANGSFENNSYALNVDIDTGKKWIDGKPIYRVVRYVWHNEAPVAGYSVSGHVISGPFTNNADTIIKFEAICVETNGHIATMGGCGYVDKTNVWYSDTSAYLSYGTALNDEWIVIEYTKTTD